MWFFSTKCPLDDESRDWVHRRMKWLADEFGKNQWLSARAVEPTDEFFPGQYDGSEAAVRRMLDRVCGFMGVEAGRVQLRLYEEEGRRLAGAGIGSTPTTVGAAGLYLKGEIETISIERSTLKEPMALVATLAHEVAHVRLLGEGRITGDEADHEPLTDLTTVFFGMGIFNANSTFRFKQWTNGRMHGWKAATLGYLNETTFGYALGLWTFMRKEPKPVWRKHLRQNPRAFMSQTVRYLGAHEPEPL